MRLFKNGNLLITGNGFAGYNFASPANAVSIGAFTGPGAVGGTIINGYVDDFIVTKGVAKYTTNFVPQLTYDIELLFNGQDGSKTFTNTGTMVFQSVIASANASISTAMPISGTGSLSLPSVSDYVNFTLPTTYDASTPVTFEFSFKKTEGTLFCPLIFYTASNSNFYPFLLYAGSLFCGGTIYGSNIISVPSTIVDGTVYRCAVTFDGTTWRMYIEGTMIGSSVYKFTGLLSTMQIGLYPGVGGSVGLIDNVKIAFGTARYTGSSYLL
jgi:hypothetical protein